MNNFFEIKIMANTSNERFIRSTVAAFCTELDPSVEELNDVKTAVSEGITNCIVHAYRGVKNGIIDIGVFLDENRVIIKISDCGCGIEDIEKALQPFYTSKPDEERSGLGFTLMQTFMDNVKVTSQKDVGTTVVMEKTFIKDVKS